MPDALIENPILNSLFAAPERHFIFTDEGITNEIVDGRRGEEHQYHPDFQCRLSLRESTSSQSLARPPRD